MKAPKADKALLGLSLYRHTHSREKENSTPQILASVREYLGSPRAEISVHRDEYGKPHLVGAEGVFVSVAHTDDICLVAVAEYEIGIDIESKSRKVKNPASLARRYFCEDEIAQLGENPSPEAFNEMWVAKEALSKLIGRGVPCMRERSIFSEGIEIVGIDDYEGYIVKIARYCN